MSSTRSADDKDAVSRALRRITEIWLAGAPRDLEELLDPRMTMVYPGFAGKAEGRDAVVAGFLEFCESARVERFDQTGWHVDVVGDVGLASFAFEMLYEREGVRYRSTGRDLWVFRRDGGGWSAVWRTMLDVTDERVDG